MNRDRETGQHPWVLALPATRHFAHVWRGMFVAPDLQYVRDPAYNRDRGPVVIPGFRLHLEL